MLEPFVWRDSLEIYWPMVVQGVLVSLSLGLIGCFLVVRGMALLGDALSHSVLPGIVAGFLVSAALGTASLHSPWILVGATAAGLAAALLVQAVQEQSRVKEDASLGIIFTTLFAVGVVMVNQFAGQSDLDPQCVLYGNLEYFASFDAGEVPSGIWPMSWITAGIVVLLVVFYRHVLISTFDPALAASLGIPSRAVHYAMMTVLSLTIVASFESVGAILPVALLILPGATARLWTDRMTPMLLLAAGHGVVSTVLGYWLSHDAVMDTSISAAICVAGFVLLLASWLLAPRQGLIPRWRARARLSRTTAMENLLKAIGDLGGRSPESAVDAAAVAGELRLPPDAVGKTLRRASSSGWVKNAAGHPAHGDAARRVSLTPAGRERSARLARAHDLWERYLRQEVGLNADHVHDAAEWVEHYLNDDELARLDEELRIAAARDAGNADPTLGGRTAQN